jgi:SAM-dependent methyltransferase
MSLAHRVGRYLHGFRRNPYLDHKRNFHQHLAVLHEAFFAGRMVPPARMWEERPCVVCGAATFEPVFTSSVGFHYVRCLGCRMTVMQPIPSAESLHQLYNSEEMSVNVSGRPAGVVRPQGQADLACVQQFVTTGRLLDIGCGAGGFVMLAGATFEAEGLEINARHAAMGQAQGLRVHEVYSSAFRPPYQYDVVTLLQVIEHLPHPASVLADAAALLRPGGLLYVACPNMESWSMRLFGPRHRHVSTFGHLNMYGPATLRRQCESAGFRCLDVTTYMLDVELHDLAYFYGRRSRFSHRFANYRPGLMRLSDVVSGRVRRRLDALATRRLQGSYLRAVFQKPVDSVGEP